MSTKDEPQPGSGREQTSRFRIASIIAAITVPLTLYLLLPEGVNEGSRRMSAIFAMALILWASEAIPLFATSLLVIALEAWLLVGANDSGAVLEYEDVLASLGNPLVVLFLGGFVLARAVRKEGMDVQMAALLLRPFGSRPGSVMAGLMAITAIFSMWMSNTATTAMMVVLAAPLAAQAPEGDRLRRGLILCIPFAANIGGIGTPIGTPPNAIALAQLADRGLTINFFEWMLFALPLVAGALFLMWILLRFLFAPGEKHISFSVTEPFRLTKRSAIVYSTFGVTVALWLSNPLHQIPNAVVAMLPPAVLTITGIIKKEDFNRLDWDVLILMAGGIALGLGMNASGFARLMVEQIPVDRLSLFGVTALVCVVVMLLSTVISNTVATNIVLPLGLAIGMGAGAGGPALQQLGAMCAITSSFAMGLPISTPPNVIAYGTGELRTRDIAFAGGIVSIAATTLIVLTGPWVISWILGGQ